MLSTLEEAIDFLSKMPSDTMVEIKLCTCDNNSNEITSEKGKIIEMNIDSEFFYKYF